MERLICIVIGYIFGLIQFEIRYLLRIKNNLLLCSCNRII